ncbi:MAG: diguanylate cyclase [Thermoleophilaceae bacterium]|nr:diguanylate cyclase [Thermoleophilaceae bacterium]
MRDPLKTLASRTHVLRLADGLPRRQVVGLRLGMALIGVIILWAVIQAGTTAGGHDVRIVTRDWAPSAVYILVGAAVVLRALRLREGRGPWTVLATGLCVYGLGNLLWVVWLQRLADPPIPSVSDAMWLFLYPAAYLGLALLARGTGRGASAGVWLDGLVAGLGVTACGAAVIFPPILDAAQGSTIAVVINLAYPVGDLLLVALVIGVASLRSWRLDGAWGLLMAGFLTLAVGDTIYLLNVAGGATSSSLVANVFYMAGVALIALAAWQPHASTPAVRTRGSSILVIPAAFAMTAVGLLMYDHYHRLTHLTATLAACTIVLALVRTALTFRDVRALSEARRQAVTDDLTSLPNRRLFMRRVEEAIASSVDSHQSFALLILDLDHFKELNDSLGHHAGDMLLRDVGPRLLPQVRDSDTLARLGGDEFGIVLAPCDEESATIIAGRMHATLKNPFEVAGLRLHVSAGIGIALFPKHATDADRLMQHADIAMYQAKESHAPFQLYESARNVHTRENLALISALPEAIEGGQLELYFQPKAETLGRRIVGAEALVRWRHPSRGLIAPDVFVPLMDRAGLGRELTRWVLDTALAECRAWRDTGHEMHVAVNATVADLIDAGLPGEVTDALAAHRLPHEALMIEVTETSILHDPLRAQNVLLGLRDLGVGVSLDDFGTGYSSLTHLKTLPVTEVKIDRSFVKSMGTNSTDAAIVAATIQLAHTLGLRVVAEGIENDSTWAHLVTLGCDLTQGYYLSRPLPAGVMLDFLSQSDLTEITV